MYVVRLMHPELTWHYEIQVFQTQAYKCRLWGVESLILEEAALVFCHRMEGWRGARVTAPVTYGPCPEGRKRLEHRYIDRPSLPSDDSAANALVMT